MADDFADRLNQPVVHVTWWGSYLDQITTPEGVDKFLIAFEKDIPAHTPGPDGVTMPFSRPGEPILSQVVKRVDLASGLAPGSGTFTEDWVSPGGPPLNETLYKYNAELRCPFPQEADTVYWLKIVALVDQETQGDIRWGWHNRDYTVPDTLASPRPWPGEHIEGHVLDPDMAGNMVPVWHFQDNAIAGYQMWVQIMGDEPCQVEIWQDSYAMEPQHYNDADGPFWLYEPNLAYGDLPYASKDLAFELYAIPEPSSIVLIGLGTVCLLAIRRRKFL